MENTFGNVFYIIKGQYRRAAPCVEVPAHGKREAVQVFLGGYDPESPDTHEWYMLMDSDTHTVHTASADIMKVLAGLYSTVLNYRTRAKMVSVTREHMTPTSYAQEVSNLEVYKKYGDYYKDLCAMVCERACGDIPDIRVRRMSNVFQQKALSKALNALDPLKVAQEVYDLWKAQRNKDANCAEARKSPMVAENFVKPRGSLSACRRPLGFVRKTFPKA